jgi:hypothetical protein
MTFIRIDRRKQTPRHSLGPWFNARLLPSIVLFLLPLCLSGASHANETCPWLNEATAGGFLNGSVTSSVTHPYRDKDDANCEFIQRDGSTVTKLEIEVETMSGPDARFASYLAKCGAHPQPVKAIGNEAVACSLDEKKGKYSELVIGRVRDRTFLVRINSNSDESTRITLRSRAQRIAEQVAGFLF